MHARRCGGGGWEGVAGEELRHDRLAGRVVELRRAVWFVGLIPVMSNRNMECDGRVRMQRERSLETFGMGSAAAHSHGSEATPQSVLSSDMRLCGTTLRTSGACSSMPPVVMFEG